MLSGYVLAGEVLRVIRAPQLATFLRRARDEDEAWAADLLQTMRDVIGKEVVESWSVTISPAQARTVCRVMAGSETVTLGQLLTRADGSGDPLQAVPLLLQRGQERMLRPALDTPLQLDDRILCCGRNSARATMRHNLVGHSLPIMNYQASERPVTGA
jgi:voltage-gated potassium channel